MTLENFYTAIKNALINENSFATNKFLENIDTAKNDTEQNDIFKMTKITVLFEGFYQSLAEHSDLKKSLLAIRIRRWENHFGTPTVSFLISHLAVIEETRQHFSKMTQQINVPNNIILNSKPDKEPAQISDFVNNVLVTKNAIATVAMPQHEETPMVWLKTHNPTGGYTLPATDPYSQKFIEHAATVTNQDERVLEIGAAFGTATLKALARGVTVDCNDIEPRNLAVVQNRYSTTTNGTNDSATGDSGKLRLLPGAFPEELSGLQAGSYKAILACRVFHFFRGAKVDAAIKKMADLLQPGGKLYVVCETPYQKNWRRFLPQFEERVAAGEEWPGEIPDATQGESTGRGAAALPKFVHHLTTDILERTAKRAGNLKVEQCSYISRKGQFTDDAVDDAINQESVGLIAVKEIRCRL
jgi:SAM-dependent methyltransferase